MRKIVRVSARGLVAALAIGAAYAAWASAGHFRTALVKTPIVAWIDEAPVAPPAASRGDVRPAANEETFASLEGWSGRCGPGGCEDKLALKPADACQPCIGFADPSPPDLAASGLVEAPPAFAEAGFDGAALDLGGDPNRVYLAGFEPIASAAPTPEISTAAMLTLGLAAIVGASRRRRRPAAQPCAC